MSFYNIVDAFLQDVRDLNFDNPMSGKKKSVYEKSLSKAQQGFTRPLVKIASDIALENSVSESLQDDAIEILEKILESSFTNAAFSAGYELVRINLILKKHEKAKLIAERLIENGFYPVYSVIAGYYHSENHGFYDLQRAYKFYKIAIKNGHFPSEVAYAKLKISHGGWLESIYGFFLLIFVAFKFLLVIVKGAVREEYVPSLHPMDYSPNFVTEKFDR